MITTDDPEPDKYQLRLWISDDKRRLPLRFAATTQLGPEDVQVEIGDQSSDLDQRVGAQVEAGHLAVNPDQSFVHVGQPTDRLRR